MTQASVQTLPVAAIGLDEHRTLSNVIQSLRSLSIDTHISSSKIVVCGDRSSGKSAVLAALTGIHFPIKGNLCTRYTIEIIFRDDSVSSTKVKIIPDKAQSEEVQTKLKSFDPSDFTLDNLSELVDAVDAVFELKKNEKGIRYDVLSVTISGPGLPNISVINVPGLDEADQTEFMDRLHFRSWPCDSHKEVTFMDHLFNCAGVKGSETIALAVISCRNPYNDQILPKYMSHAVIPAKQFMGVLTKPEVLEIGSSEESSFYELARGRKHHVAYGWHVLLNSGRPSNVLDTSPAVTAADFLDRGIWSSLPDDQKGIGSLRARLRQILKDRLAMHVRGLVGTVDTSVNKTRGSLEALGDVRPTRIEQQLYLCRIARQFSTLLTSAISGDYSRIAALIDHSMQSMPDDLRLKSSVQNIFVRCNNELVAVDAIRKTGQGTSSTSQFSAEALQTARDPVRARQYTEVPGNLSAAFIRELFLHQSMSWQPIVTSYIDEVIEAVSVTASMIINHVSDVHIGKELTAQIIGPALEQLKNDLTNQMQDYLDRCQTACLTGFDEDLRDRMHEACQQSRKEVLSQKLQQNLNSTSTQGASIRNMSAVDLDGLVEFLAAITADPIDAACTNALASMQVCYKV